MQNLPPLPSRWQRRSAEVPLGAERDGAATSHSLLSLQLIFLKYISQSFPETLGQGSPVTRFVAGSWMWHCSAPGTSSVLPGLPWVQRSQDLSSGPGFSKKMFLPTSAPGQRAAKPVTHGCQQGTNPALMARPKWTLSNPVTPNTDPQVGVFFQFHC